MTRAMNWIGWLRLPYLILVVIYSMILVLSLTACQSTPDPASSTTTPYTHHAEPLALSPDGNSLWVVNPDANSVTQVDTRSNTFVRTLSVGDEPWAVAVTPSNRVVVMNRASGSLTLIDGSQVTQEVPVGAEPGGFALAPSGDIAYVTLSSEDAVAVVDLEQARVLEHLKVGRLPWRIAVHQSPTESPTLIVTHRLARLRPGGREGSNDGKHAWLSVIRDQQVQEVVITPYDFGFANVLEGITITNDIIFVAHQLNSPAGSRAPFQSVSGALSSLSLTRLQELPQRHIDTNASGFSTPVNFPRAVAVTADAQRAYLALAGTDAIMGIDLSQPTAPRLIGFWAVGKNPRGIVLSPDGTQAYVMNYLSRDVSVLDLSNTVQRPELARIQVSDEVLPDDMWRGKVFFNNANDPRLSSLGWVSCASCHVDGGVDGTSWHTPEGLRQTQPLWQLAGSAPFHASATRDEVQDFESDIEQFMGGVGLAPGAAAPLLGEPNSNRSTDLDALANFTLRGIRVPNATAGEPALVTQGRNLFVSAGCHTCHGGVNWTNSQLPNNRITDTLEVRDALRDVGTFNPNHDILGENGFDIPTLLGIHASAPYLHDGSAATLKDVFDNITHMGQQFDDGEVQALEAFLNNIDSTTSTLTE